MTLKGVHIIFIISSVIASVFFGIWALGKAMFFVSAPAFLCALVLAAYAAVFTKKVRP